MNKDTLKKMLESGELSYDELSLMLTRVQQVKARRAFHSHYLQKYPTPLSPSEVSFYSHILDIVSPRPFYGEDELQECKCKYESFSYEVRRVTKRKRV